MEESLIIGADNMDQLLLEVFRECGRNANRSISTSLCVYDIDQNDVFTFVNLREVDIDGIYTCVLPENVQISVHLCVNKTVLQTEREYGGQVYVDVTSKETTQSFNCWMVMKLCEGKPESMSILVNSPCSIINLVIILFVFNYRFMHSAGERAKHIQVFCKNTWFDKCDQKIVQKLLSSIG